MRGLILAALLAPLAAHSADWEEAGRTKEGNSIYQYKTDSIEVEQVATESYAVAIIRTLNPAQPVSFYKEKVAHSACLAGYGTLNTHDLSNKFLFKSDFAKSGGNVASGLAEFICAKAWDRAIKDLIVKAAAEVDYINDSRAAEQYDRILGVMQRDPANRRRSMEWIVAETHRQLLLTRKTAPQ